MAVAVAVAGISVRCLRGVARRPCAADPARGAVSVGAAKTGMVATGMAVTGAVATGMAAIGTTGMAIGIITITTRSSLSVTSAFRGGGAGGHFIRGDLLTDITVMAILTAVTDMVATMGMEAVTDTAATDLTTTKVRLDMATDPARDQGWPSCNAGSPAQAITMAPLMESWGRKRVEQSALTSAPTDTQTQADPASRAEECDETGRLIFRLVDRWISQGAKGEPPVIHFRYRNCWIAAK